MYDNDKILAESIKLNKTLKESYGKMLGTIFAGPGAGEKNGKALANKQGVQGFSGAMREEEEVLDLEAPVDDAAGDDAAAGELPDAGAELDVAVDADADGVDDAVIGDGSDAKLGADAVAQAYLSQLPTDVILDADDQGIVYAEFNDPTHGVFKIALFPAAMSLADVAAVKDPVADDVEGAEGLEGEEGLEGATDDVAGLDAGADLAGDGAGLDVAGTDEVEGEVEDEVEQPIMESVRDKRLRRKGLIGNTRDAGEEEALLESARDPMREGRRSWKALLESRKVK